ncbi:MAG: hypothetical protein OXI41_09565 [Chloroflexota bacterium]|nr:hypothetical protein [Chloroflexota bacterium]MDE2896133.1 hypothetical protein [Chloroflexota bacterium]
MNDDELLQWSLDLESDEREYLLKVSSSENATTVELTSAQDSKIIALFGWSVLGIGTVAVADILVLTWDLQGISSMLAIAASTVVLLAGTFALWPRSLSLGVNTSWFLDWQRPTKDELQSFALAALIKSNQVNDRLLERRSDAQKVMGLALTVQVVLIVLALVADAVGG